MVKPPSPRPFAYLPSSSPDIVTSDDVESQRCLPPYSSRQFPTLILEPPFWLRQLSFCWRKPPLRRPWLSWSGLDGLSAIRRGKYMLKLKDIQLYWWLVKFLERESLFLPRFELSPYQCSWPNDYTYLGKLATILLLQRDR